MATSDPRVSTPHASTPHRATPSLRGAARSVALLAAVTYALGGTLVVLSLWVVVARIAYPIDAEWMTGAIRDAVERVRDGKPLYVAPSARFIPFVYPPLYFWISGLIARFCPSFVACKVVSLGSTVAAGWGIWRIARSLGATPRWSRVALLLFVATYSLTILFYDLERVDGLYAGMILVALAVLFRGRSLAASAVAGALLGVAFFAKQAGLLAFAAAVVGLALAGERRRAAVVLGAGLAAFALTFGWLEATTEGWFRYYCLKLPGAHGIRAQRLTTFFIQDAPKAFAITAASVAFTLPVLMGLIRDRRRSAADAAEVAGATDESAPPARAWQEIVLAAIIAASMAAAFSFRAHSGGWPNVLVAWLPLGCPAFAIVASRAEERARGTRVEHVMSMALLGAASLQLLGAMFDPMELAPDAEDMRDRERFVTLVRELEREGEVWVLPTGHLTKETGAHAAALYDVLRAGGRAPPDLLARLEERHYAAIVVDIPVDCDFAQCDELEMVIARNYFVAARRHEREHTGMTGYDARPRWIFRPRKTPVTGAHATKDGLFTRQKIEKSLAEMKTALLAPDVEPRPSAEIEQMAARQLEAR